MDNREKILEGTIKLFQKKGLKFTMDDIALELGMSKKTIYKEFKDKEALFQVMVDYCFDKIKVSEQLLIEDRTLDSFEKFKRILSVMPDSYLEIDFRQLYPLKEKYPAVYAKMQERLETGWDATFSLMEECMEKGQIRKIEPGIFKVMMESALEKFLQDDFLIKNGISYQSALEQVVDILLRGIII